MIKQLVLEGPGHRYILCYDSTSDGCVAWCALVNHFEGDGFCNHNIEEAHTKAPEIAAAKQQVRATHTLTATFQDTVNFIA